MHVVLINITMAEKKNTLPFSATKSGKKVKVVTEKINKITYRYLDGQH